MNGARFHTRRSPEKFKALRILIGTVDFYFFEPNFVNIFLSISFYGGMGAQKNYINETVLLSTHNICFGCEIKKFTYPLLSRGL